MAKRSLNKSYASTALLIGVGFLEKLGSFTSTRIDGIAVPDESIWTNAAVTSGSVYTAGAPVRARFFRAKYFTFVDIYNIVAGIVPVEYKVLSYFKVQSLLKVPIHAYFKSK